MKAQKVLSFLSNTSQAVRKNKGGGTGGARGAIALPLFTDHFKMIFYLITVTQKIFNDISDTKIGLE